MVLEGYSGSGYSNNGSADATRARASASAAQRDVQFMEDRLERLSLVCMAMWSLLQDKTNLTEADLLERVKLIDQMDGKNDGKATRGVMICHHCQRTLNPRHAKCLYCGTPRKMQSAFDGI